MLLQNLDAAKKQLESLSKQYGELEAKSKADVKVLVKEVKSLRKSQTELKKELGGSIKDKCEAEVGYFHWYAHHNNHLFDLWTQINLWIRMYDLYDDAMLVFSCIQKLLLHEREKREQAEAGWRELTEKCKLLFSQLQECNVSLPYDDEDRKIMNPSSLHDASNRLTTADDQIDILLAEVQILSFLWLSVLLLVRVDC